MVIRVKKKQLMAYSYSLIAKTRIANNSSRINH